MCILAGISSQILMSISTKLLPTFPDQLLLPFYFEMSSSLNIVQSSRAAVFLEHNACMASWTVKLCLAMDLHNTWERLDPNQYHVSSTARAVKAMELVKQMVTMFFFASSYPMLTLL